MIEPSEILRYLVKIGTISDKKAIKLESWLSSLERPFENFDEMYSYIIKLVEGESIPYKRISLSPTDLNNDNNKAYHYGYKGNSKRVSLRKKNQKTKIEFSHNHTTLI